MKRRKILFDLKVELCFAFNFMWIIFMIRVSAAITLLRRFVVENFKKIVFTHPFLGMFFEVKKNWDLWKRKKKHCELKHFYTYNSDWELLLVSKFWRFLLFTVQLIIVPSIKCCFRVKHIVNDKKMFENYNFINLENSYLSGVFLF